MQTLVKRVMTGHLIVWLALLGAYSCSGGSTLVTPSTPPGLTVQVVETTGDRAKLLQQQPGVTFTKGSSNTGIVINVRESIRYQQMDGFGASLTDSSAWVVANKLTPAQKSSLWQSLFSPSDGIGISFLRQPMGATDFSATGNYSYDDMPAGQTDPTLANFSIAHDTAYITPLLQQALKVNPKLKITGVPWSPPGWMKTSGTMNGGNINPAYFSSLAQYFVKFVQGYQQEGIPIYAVMPQNEPLNSNSSYPTAYLAPSHEAEFVGAYLGPAFAMAGLGNVKILGYDHNWDNTDYAQTVLADSTASSYVAGTAFHCYGGDVSAQVTIKNAYPDKDIWFTECSGTMGSKFADDLVWNVQNLLIGATRNWGRSVSLWNLILDQNSGPQNGGCTRCRGIVTVDDSTTPATITNNVEYYVLGHAAKFVQAGAYRIDTNSFGHGAFESVAFQNPDGSIVLIVLNSGNSSSFAVNWKTETFNYSLPSGAVATFIWKQ